MCVLQQNKDMKFSKYIKKCSLHLFTRKFFDDLIFKNLGIFYFFNFVGFATFIRIFVLYVPIARDPARSIFPRFIREMKNVKRHVHSVIVSPVT